MPPKKKEVQSVGADGKPRPSQKTLPKRLLYPQAEAAHLLGISPRSLSYLIARKKINTRRIGKLVLIPRSELLRFSRADHCDNIRQAC